MVTQAIGDRTDHIESHVDGIDYKENWLPGHVTEMSHKHAVTEFVTQRMVIELLRRTRHRNVTDTWSQNWYRRCDIIGHTNAKALSCTIVVSFTDGFLFALAMKQSCLGLYNC